MSASRRRSWAAALLLSVTLAACARTTPTTLTVVIDTDLGVPGELQRVEVDALIDGEGSSSSMRVDFTRGDAPGLPLLLELRARRSDAPVTVEVRGFLVTGEILVRNTSTELVPGSARMLRIVLASLCVGRTCAVSETCDESGCRAVEIPGAELPGWTGTAARIEGEACVPRDELCNLLDDDCDDAIDEDFSILEDPNNCGRCGHTCATGTCANAFCAGEAPMVVAAGGAHTCVVRENGGLACFGWNLDGQTTAPGIASHARPFDVSASETTAIALGGAFGCALDAGGLLRCFGDGDGGALGVARLLDSRTPSRVASASVFVAVGAGVGHACAVTSAGAVECWGRNERGQIGDGSTTTALAPTPAWPSVVTGVTSVAAGFGHTCALLTDGRVMCWGGDERGQLGDGSIGGAVTAPVPVVGLDSVSAIAAGRDFTCALRMGSVLCWGANSFGQLGATGSTESSTPLVVTPLANATAITAAPGGTHACALREGGTVSCWGSNRSAQLGDGTTGASTVPLDVLDLPPAIAVAAGGLDDLGYGHTCAIAGGGGVLCWGDGALRQNGSAEGFDLSAPTPVAFLP